MSTPRGVGYRGRDRRIAPAPYATASPATLLADAAAAVALAGVVCAAAATLHAAVPRATPAATLLLAGLATGACFVVAEQTYVRWRLVGDAVAARLSAGYIVFGATVVPLATTRADGAPGAIAQAVGTLGAAGVLLTTLGCPDVDTRKAMTRPVLAATAAAAVTVVVTAAVPLSGVLVGRVEVLGTPWVEVLPGLLLVVAAGGVTAAGVRRRRRTVARTGVALGLLVTTPAVAAAGATPPAAHLLAAAVQAGAVALVITSSVADTRLALHAVGRDNTALRHRWLDAAAEVRDLRGDDAERSHELRSALLALQGASDVLCRHVEGLGRPEDAALAGALASELGRLHQLVARARPTPVVQYGLRTALAPVVLARRACGQRIDVDIPPDTTVLGRPAALAEAVGNLLANADTHARGAFVSLSSSVHDGRVRLLVRDDGPGLDPSAVTRAAVRRDADGTHGLGLAVAARLVAEDGGHLTALAGPGATIVIDLPCGRVTQSREPWAATAAS